MEIMDLVCRDRRSLEDRQSCVSKDGLMRLARGPVFARHVAVVGAGSAPGEAVAPVIRTHSVEAVAACHLSFEMVDVREFDIRHGDLIVIAVLVEPRNRIRARAAIRRLVVLRDGRGTVLLGGLRTHQRTWQPGGRRGSDSES